MASIKTTEFKFIKNQFSFDDDGNLNAFFERNVSADGLSPNQYLTSVEKSEAFASNDGELKSGYLEEVIKFKIKFGGSSGDIQLDEITEKFYYRIDTTTSQNNFLSINVTLWDSEDPCSSTPATNKTLYYLKNQTDNPIGQFLYESNEPNNQQYFYGKGYTYIQFEGYDGLFRLVKQGSDEFDQYIQWYADVSTKKICEENPSDTSSDTIRFTASINPIQYLEGNFSGQTVILITPKNTSTGSPYQIKQNEIKISVLNSDNVNAGEFKYTFATTTDSSFIFNIPKLLLINSKSDGKITYKIEDTSVNKYTTLFQVIRPNTNDNSNCNTIINNSIPPSNRSNRSNTLECNGKTYIWVENLAQWVDRSLANRG